MMEFHVEKDLGLLFPVELSIAGKTKLQRIAFEPQLGRGMYQNSGAGDVSCF